MKKKQFMIKNYEEKQKNNADDFNQKLSDLNKKFEL